MRALMLAFVVAAVALAGCTGDDDGGSTTTSTSSSHSTSTSTSRTTSAPTTSTTTTTGAPSDTTTELTFTASPTSGNVTLTVEFAASLTDRDSGGAASPHDDPFTWNLMFGDGTDASGDEGDFPLETSHDYATAGEFTATMTVTLDTEEELEDSEIITVAAGEEPQEPPQLVFEFGPSLGCAGDVLQAAGGDCITALLGPGATGPDGFWIPLDERYWGLSMTSTTDLPNALGDTDGYFLDADEAVMSADINNGSGPAQGTVPNGAAWLFVYNYAVPSISFVVTFT